MNKSIDFNALKSAFVLRRVSNMAQRFLNVIYFVGFRLLTVISYKFTISPLSFSRKCDMLWSATERGAKTYDQTRTVYEPYPSVYRNIACIRNCCAVVMLWLLTEWVIIVWKMFSFFTSERVLCKIEIMSDGKGGITEKEKQARHSRNNFINNSVFFAVHDSRS